MTSREIMRRYLAEVGQLEMSVGGPEMMGPQKRRSSPAAVQASADMVRKQIDTNRIVLWFGLAMIFVVMAAAIVATFKAGPTTKAVLAIGGIGSGAEAGLLAWVLVLWSEYNKFIYLLMLSQSLTPDEFTKVVLTIYSKKDKRL